MLLFACLQEVLKLAEKLQEKFLGEFSGTGLPSTLYMKANACRCFSLSLSLSLSLSPFSVENEEFDVRDLRRVQREPIFVARYVRHQGGNLDNAFNHMVGLPGVKYKVAL